MHGYSKLDRTPAVVHDRLLDYLTGSAPGVRLGRAHHGLHRALCLPFAQSLVSHPARQGVAEALRFDLP